MKIYYEPNEDVLLLNQEVKALAERFDCLEYAVSDGRIDSINFHTDCKNIDDIVTEFDSELISSIGKIFDVTYKPYTLGYRTNGGKSIYYYPTIWKETRFGISGIQDTKTICNQFDRFFSFVSASNDCKNWICEQLPYITKFKGVCITNYQKIISYKLYYRMSAEGIQKIEIPKCNVEQYCEKYGDVVLVSVGIVNGEVDKFNLYFLR